MGMMGYKTPNIDRIAKEGALFTDWYGQQSCTAGRAAFITGQSPIRTGLTKVGLPGAPEGMKKEDPTIAELLKPLGYTSGQFGKNHLGDRDDMLPTNHGFDEFYGNLYHLNAEEEPDNPDYPKNPEFKKKFGPRGVIRSYAGGKIEDTGPLIQKRMETVDEEVTTAALAFMDKAVKDGKPFFVWWNSTRMHIFTHLKPSSEGKTGLGIYADGMVEHDAMVGQLLAKLKELGVEDNTIVMYSTDNGAETFTWPDGGTTMFRGEKNTNWEGGYRVPTVIRWPGVIKPGTVINDTGAHEDMMTTLLAAAGDPNVKDELLKGKAVGGMTYKVHLDGYDLGPALRGKPPGRAKSSSTGLTTAASRRCAMETGRSTSSNKTRRVSRYGSNPLPNCGPPRSPICGWIPSSTRRKRTRWATSAGTSSTCSPSHPPARMSDNGCRAFRVPTPPEARRFQPRPRDAGIDQSGGWQQRLKR